MTDERLHDPFETDLRAVLAGLAPRETPGALRAAVTEIPFETARSSRWSWLPQSRRLVSAFLLVAVIVVAGVLLVARGPAGPGNGIPTPYSSLISSFVEQTDGVAGYRMLRPTNWTALGGDPIDGRSYVGPGPANAQQGIVVSVLNLKLVAASLGANTVDAQWLLFQQDPSLVGWTAGIEAMWARDSETFTLLRTLPDAKIYMLSLTTGSRSVFLVAYAIDQGQPLILELQASGTEADLSRLEAEGIVDDFATMAGSITAVPADPQNVVPALPTLIPSPVSSAAVPSGTPAPGCTAGDLSISAVNSGGGLGTVGGSLRFQNVGKSPCTLSGYPQVAGITASGVRTTARRSSSPSLLDYPQISGTPVVTLEPGESAVAAYAAGDNPIGTADSCPPPYHTLEVEAPGTEATVLLPAFNAWLGLDLPSCSGIEVTPVIAAALVPSLSSFGP